MLRNYFKIAWRSMLRNKAYALINIAGLSAGMTVAMLIGFWIWDELSYNKYHQNYDRIAQVMLHQTYGGEVNSQTAIPIPLSGYLKTHYEAISNGLCCHHGTRRLFWLLTIRK